MVTCCVLLALALPVMRADGARAEMLPLSSLGIGFHDNEDTVKTSGALRISSDDPRLGPLVAPVGKSVTVTEDGDAESLTITRQWVAGAFEGTHRLWFYQGPNSAFSYLPASLPRLPTFARAHRDKGIEALTALSDGRLLALAKHFLRAEGDFHGWVTDQSVWRSLTYGRTGRVLPVGAAALPGGGALMLERRFTWGGGFGARIVRIAAAAIRPGRRMNGTEITKLSPPLVSANLEGIAVRRSKGGGTLTHLIDDDNFHPL